MEQELKKIEGVEILGVELDFYCVIPHGCLNLGSVRLEREGRSFVYDTVQSEWYKEDNRTIVRVTLQAGIEGSSNEDVDSEFDLTAEDLLASNLVATIFMEADEENDYDEEDDELEGVQLSYVDPDSKTLFVRIGEMTKAIDLVNED
jgi:hypothetical protein